jgi:hypothetical protein
MDVTIKNRRIALSKDSTERDGQVGPFVFPVLHGDIIADIAQSNSDAVFRLGHFSEGRRKERRRATKARKAQNLSTALICRTS